MLEKVIQIAEEAAHILIQYYQGSYETSYKGGIEIVTTADIEVNNFLHKKFQEAFPGDQILSEETPNMLHSYRGNVWIIDPLDGTKNFTEKSQYFSINIGLCVDGLPVLGVIISPARDEMHYAEKGKGAFRRKNGIVESIHVSDIANTADGRLITNIPDGKERKFDTVIAGLHVRERIPRGSWGILLITTGEAEAYIHASYNLKKWDTCGPQVVIEEAGGKVTDIAGNPLDYTQQSDRWENSVIASNAKIHNELIQEIQKLS